MFDLMVILLFIEVCSNWLLYLQEFVRVCEFYGKVICIEKVVMLDLIIFFEEKYLCSGQDCWVLRSIDVQF